MLSFECSRLSAFIFACQVLVRILLMCAWTSTVSSIMFVFHMFTLPQHAWPAHELPKFCLLCVHRCSCLSQWGWLKRSRWRWTPTIRMEHISKPHRPKCNRPKSMRLLRSVYVVVICFSDVCFQLSSIRISLAIQFRISCCSYGCGIPLHRLELSPAFLSGSVRFPMCSALPISLLLLLMFDLNKPNHSWMYGRTIAHGVATIIQIFLSMFAQWWSSWTASHPWMFPTTKCRRSRSFFSLCLLMVNTGVHMIVKCSTMRMVCGRWSRLSPSKSGIYFLLLKVCCWPSRSTSKIKKEMQDQHGIGMLFGMLSLIRSKDMSMTLSISSGMWPKKLVTICGKSHPTRHGKHFGFVDVQTC